MGRIVLEATLEQSWIAPSLEELSYLILDRAVPWRQRNFGIDLTFLIERLQLTAEERLGGLQLPMTAFAHIRGAARKPRAEPRN